MKKRTAAAECVAYFESPVGWLEIRATQDAVTRLEFAAKPGRASGNPTPPLKECLKQLRDYFAKKRSRFELPLSADGTAFQKKIWRELAKIPYGQTRSYGEIARAAGNPKASRAVGGANNKNPIAIVVPCHRVIGSCGKLVGYAGGMGKKQWLLDHERS